MSNGAIKVFGYLFILLCVFNLYVGFTTPGSSGMLNLLVGVYMGYRSYQLLKEADEI